MAAVVCGELLARGGKAFLRRKLEGVDGRGLDDALNSKRLRECAESLGLRLR